MFYRVTNFQYAPDRQQDIESWVTTKTELVRAIDGLVAVDVFEAMPGESIIVASYENQAAFDAAAGTVGSVLGELGQFLNGPPITASGTPFWTTRV